MKNSIKIMFLALLAIWPAVANAQWGAIAGIAKTIGSITDTLYGTTTITPTCYMYTWDYYYKEHEDEPYGPYSDKMQRMKARYDFTFAQTSFSDDQEYDGITYGGGNSSFTPQPPQVALWNWNCNYIGHTEKLTQTFTIAMTCTQVSTGLIVPSGPWQCCAKTQGTYMPMDCSDTNTYSREFRKALQVPTFGHVTGILGHANYAMAWPCQVWAGDPYQY